MTSYALWVVNNIADDIDDQILSEVTAATLVILRRKREGNKIWVRGWVARRSRLGAYSCLLKEISSEDSPECRRFLWMSSCTFNELLHLIEPAIHTQDTVITYLTVHLPEPTNACL